MNTKRIFTWGTFILIIGLITWGMIAAANKAEKESAGMAPVDAVAENDWVKGNASSTITLIEYSDFQCPACAAYYPLIEDFISKDSDKFKFVYRHFPLSIHANAMHASKASEAAGIQGKFWEMHSLLFVNQNSWATSTTPKTVFEGYAKDLGLDLEKFSADYDLPEIAEKIDNSMKSGVKAGVNSTPSFFLNGKKVSPQNYEQFKKLIDEANTNNS